MLSFLSIGTPFSGVLLVAYPANVFDGLSEMSNCYCYPGKAVELTFIIKNDYV
jgi:hypothetical protein